MPVITVEKLRTSLLRANSWLAPPLEVWAKQMQRGCGYANRRSIVVAPHKCAIPGRGYSWPGAASDRTLTGVYAHEFGHYLNFNMRDPRAACEMLVQAKSPRVSSYEPNPSEVFAETFRVYACNPDLLLQGRPRRFEVMQKLAGHPPIRPWDEIMQGAPQRYVDWCEKWIQRGKTGE